ncbi:MAG: putative transcriptional regulator [Chthonomonadales bacterium]|nr:putative transcriptional regulator [Chthonomonadales bacterium]
MMLTLYPDRRGPVSASTLSTLPTPNAASGRERAAPPHEVRQTRVVYSKRRDTDPYFWQGADTLSLKYWITGQGLYEAEGGRFAVRPRTYLLLNSGQHYSISREPEAEEESLLVFFTSDLVAGVFRSLTNPTELLLDEPDREIPAIHFYQKLYRDDSILAPRLARFPALLSEHQGEVGWLESAVYDLAEGLLKVHQAVGREVEQMSALRPATRDELYRRICYARDYAAANPEEPLSLQQWASVACLSPNHFLRTFKQVYHLTPHQYLIQLRLQKAQEFLRRTDLSITEICFEVGFESLGSFSTLFRRQIGVSPLAYRLQNTPVRFSPITAPPGKTD